MDEVKKLQRLHQLAVKGEALTMEEQAALQNWYEILDHEESLMLNQSAENQMRGKFDNDTHRNFERNL